MTDQEILDNAPEGATHVEIYTMIQQKPRYWKREYMQSTHLFGYWWWDSINGDWLLSNSITGDFARLSDIKELVENESNKDFKRLCIEYLPLKFSRRHGDPSRPWNRFSINTKSEVDGSKVLDYEGNWRDIFQNWEALAHGYPQFIESMIHKFLNATTFEGYNPYRVTKDGFDWEVIEENDPWSYIGYWGDHQIIYLLKFLEFIEKHYPSKLAA